MCIKKTSTIRSCVATRYLAAALLFSSTALKAQTAGTTGGQTDTTSQNVLQEVVVSAQFRQERLQDTPIAITALTAQSLNERGISDISQIGSVAPNVAMSLGATAGNFGGMTSVFIRGIGQSDPHFAVEPGVGIYIDDVYYGVTPGNLFSLLDTDRIDVLRGPQGTLSGKNSEGGSIKLYSEHPGPDADGYAELTLGDYSQIGGKAATSFTITDGQLYGRIAFGAVRRDGYMNRVDYACETGSGATQRTGDSCLLGSQGGQDSTVGRAELRWIPSAKIDDLLILDVLADNSENPATKQIYAAPAWAGTNNYITCPTCYSNFENYVSLPVSGPSAGVPFTLPSTTPTNQWGLSNNLKYALSDTLSFVAITAERQNVTVFAATDEATPASLEDQVWRLADRQFTQELRLTGDAGRVLDWTVGGFYYDANGSSGGRVNIPFGLAPGGGDLGLGIADDILFKDPVVTRDVAGYLHTGWHFTQRLTFAADVRYTADWKDFTFNRWNSLGEPNPAIPGLINYRVDYHGDRTDYRFDVEYRWTDNLMTYAQVSTGYKGGGVNPRPFFTSQATTYQPETVTNYEMGLKSEFLDRRATVDVAGFFDNYDDFQGTLTSCNAYSPFPGAPCAMTANVGSAHIYGAELESHMVPIEGLKLDLSAGWLRFEYISVNAGTGITMADTNIFTPKMTADAGLQYSIHLNGAGSLTPRIDYFYRGSMYDNFVNAPVNYVTSLGLVNGHLTWSDSRQSWQAIVGVTNLLNKWYFTSTTSADAPPPAPQLWGSYIARVGEPREFTISARRNF